MNPAVPLPLPHGGNLAAAASRFPHAPRPFLDLSTGINPVPYPLPDLPPDAFARLPEAAALEALQGEAARAYGIADPAMVVPAPGTQILLSLLPHLLPQATVAIPGPTYAEHAAAWTAAGHAVTDRPDARHRVLCNPNNPDGRTVEAGSLPWPEGVCVIDEAFADFHPEVSLAPLLPRRGLVILRSFGKTYGLAGMRLGFALAAPPLAARLRAAIGPWPVSGPALAAGRAALPDTAWLAEARARLDTDGAALDHLLAHAGFRPIGGIALFRLVEHANAAAIAERLGRAGIIVRSFAEAPHRLRFGIPTAPGLARLAAALGD
jgi:cobalamin biosynthetic protein CobC